MYTIIAFFFFFYFSPLLFHPVSSNVQVLSLFFFPFFDCYVAFPPSGRLSQSISAIRQASKRALRIDSINSSSPLCAVCCCVEPLTSPSCVCLRWTRPTVEFNSSYFSLHPFLFPPLFPRAILWVPFFHLLEITGIVNEAVQVDITYCQVLLAE